MSKMKHTPGPWSVSPLEGKYYGTKIEGPEYEDICRLWSHDDGLGEGEPRVSIREQNKLRSPGMTDEEWNHLLDEYLCDTHYEMQHDYVNACLIAAAPDMLEALKEIAALGGIDKAGGSTIALSTSHALQMRIIARAAAAKATGEA